MSETPEGFEILEHTADVGVRSWGPSLEETFRQATLGLLDIVGAYTPGRPGTTAAIEVEAGDLGGLLVDWLGEVLYLQEVRDVVVATVRVDRVTERSAGGSVELTPRPVEIEGTAVKAITYHQLSVEQRGDGWTATVFVDI
ncbi:MAG TPA: archease [Actinomycetota bacterium]|nr:archease [Actinomycetota bacterium]